MDAQTMATLLESTADAVSEALSGLDDWGLAGTTKASQYRSDLVADAAALEVLGVADVDIVSEESALTHSPGSEVTVVIDPLDGSTNALRRLPATAISMCAIDAAGPLASLVVELPTSTRWTARRGEGAQRNGVGFKTPTPERLENSIVTLNGAAPIDLGVGQYRAFGAAAVELCHVAYGGLDGYVSCDRDGHGPWDYLGAWLVCAEAGATMVDAFGRDLIVIKPEARRTVMAGGSTEFVDELIALRHLWE
jgi:myo-inositol-1(or 4)-monophosphatase